MKILITGHLGFIGQNLWQFLSTNHDVVGYHWDAHNKPNVNNCDAVIHLGAISSTTERDVDKILTQNLEFSKWLFHECAENNITLQYASSASVYGNGSDFSETADPDPKSPYAWSKYLFDRWVGQQKHQNVVQGFRYFNVYGPHEEHKLDQASPVYKFRRQAITERRIKLFERSDNYKRDFVFVGDLCKIHLQMLQQQVSGLFNVGTGVPVSFAKVAETIAEKYQAKIDLIKMPTSIESQYQTFTCANNRALNHHVQLEWTSVFDYIAAMD